MNSKTEVSESLLDSCLDTNTLTWFELFSSAGFRDNSGEHENGGMIRTVSAQSQCKVNFPLRLKNALFVEVEVQTVFRLIRGWRDTRTSSVDINLIQTLSKRCMSTANRNSNNSTLSTLHLTISASAVNNILSAWASLLTCELMFNWFWIRKRIRTILDMSLGQQHSTGLKFILSRKIFFRKKGLLDTFNWKVLRGFHYLRSLSQDSSHVIRHTVNTRVNTEPDGRLKSRSSPTVKNMFLQQSCGLFRRQILLFIL